MSRARTTISLLFGLGILAPTAALARAPVDPPPAAGAPVALTPGSLGAQLVEIADAMKGQDATCATHCYTLDHLTLRGDLKTGKLDFELDGAVLARGVDVSLFGTPEKVRLENVTENGRPATIGFEADRYFFRPTSDKFVLRGTVTIGDDRTLALPTPLNRFDGKITGGRITEGDLLSGLESGTLHFDAEDAAPAPAPTIFSLSRALRVKKNVEFEYRLTVQGSSDLGLVHLPLRFGEKVVDVVGSTGWKIEGEDLVLPTTGNATTVTVTGIMTQFGSFTVDPRSPFEWWLLESDQDHRLITSGDAKQHDSTESPIPRKEVSGRLFMLTKGQKLDVSLQTLATMEVLSAVVHRMDRHVVLTSSGDLVSEDTYAYENSGIDYLHLTPNGKPLFLSIDGGSERLMHKDGESALMVPLRVGSHTVVTQSIDDYAAGLFGGRKTFASPELPLATGHATLTVGLPADVHPFVVTGGDRTQWPFGRNDGIAFAVAALVSALALRGAKKRALGFMSLAGLWCFSHPVFGVVVAATAVTGAIIGISKLSPKARRWTLGVTAASALVALTAYGNAVRNHDGITASGGQRQPGVAYAATDTPVAAGFFDRADNDATLTGSGEESRAFGGSVAMDDGAKLGNFRAQLSQSGMVDGVRPVALSMPSSHNQVFVQTEMVSAGKPFSPTIYYVTDTGLLVLGILWLTGAASLAWSERERLKAARQKMRAWLTPDPAPPSPAMTSEDAPAPAE
ncbi:hypothetical protein BH09MYX1_BH09MYX1_53220 [soil metagenome]